MTNLFDAENRIVGRLFEESIVTKYGEELKLRDDELHHHKAGHVGYFYAGTVYNFYRNPVASDELNWANT